MDFAIRKLWFEDVNNYKDCYSQNTYNRKKVQSGIGKVLVEMYSLEGTHNYFLLQFRTINKETTQW